MNSVAAARHISVAIVVGAIGCGRVDFGSIADAPATDAPATGDAGLGVFVTPIEVPGLSLPGTDDDDPVVSSNGLELYFGSIRAGGVGGNDIWLATRSSTSDPWGTPMVVTELSSGSNETQPALCCGDLVMYLGSGRAGGLGMTDVWRATRTSLTTPWSTPVHIPELSTSGYDAASPPADEREVILDTDRGSGGDRQLYRAVRPTPQDTWSTPELIPELAAGQTKVDPWFATPQLVVYSSIPDDDAGYFEIYTAARPAPGASFGTTVHLDSIGTDRAERDPWLSSDGRTIYFARESAAGDYDLFTATR
jgi:hypothetical protein